jgi:hypothetical protein
MKDPIAIVRRIEDILGLDFLKESGGVFNSPLSTIRNGKFYLLGLNPGQSGISPEDKTRYSIGYNLKKTMSPTNTEHIYVNDQWPMKSGKMYPAGMAPFQKSVNSFFEAIGQDLRQVCSSNLHFKRTDNEKSLDDFLRNNQGIIDRTYEVHNLILNEISPKGIVVFSKTTYNQLKRMLSQGLEDPNKLIIPGSRKKIECGHGKWEIRLRKFQQKDGKKYSVIWVPHFSYYSFHTKPKILKETIAETIKEYIK